MVEYLYTGNYTAPYYNQKDKENDAISPPLFHAMMAELADKYLMSELQLLSVEKFKKIARHPWDCPILLPSIADIYSLQGESNKTLREILIESVREQITASQHFEFYLALNQATDEVPAFTKDLLFSFISQPVLSSCNNCGRGKAVPIKPLQCKCADCGEGAARHLRIGW
ncbi:Anaphase-promoting complex subunit 23 [Conoideocrella luteorostrata]|uniref:Anaphase-promoting complex subunit 23 n=1 Tax=Conoideocrella luteorostrata TaxID=1105319 RepID=A0AAJ0CI14_9HYPO|nr:Anaphase-promoting complex subunit 23 [Conoideocrella luteorostrata]